MPELEQVAVAHAAEVEPLLRTVRAELAQLSLQVRAAAHEADQLEAALAEDDGRARALLRTSLDELIATRRQDLEQALEQDLVRGAAVVAAAQEDVARARLDAPMDEEAPPAPEPPRRLQVVSDAPGDGHQADAEAPGDVRVDDVLDHVVDPVTSTADARLTTAVVDAPQVAAVVEAAEVDDDGDQRPDGAADPGRAERRPARPDDAELSGDPTLLRELVSAAVTAAVSQAVGTVQAAGPQAPPAAGPMGPVGPVGPYHPMAVPPAETVGTGRPKPALRRRLLHVDVLLPLALVAIVFVILLAWVG